MLEQERAAWFEQAYGRALALLERGEAQEAERELRAIQRSSPGEVNSLRVLGLALLAQGRGGEGVAALEAAIAAAPDFVHARVDLAAAYRAEGRLDAAAETLRRALAIDGTLHAAWGLFGDLLTNLGEFAEARRAFDRYAATDPCRRVLDEARVCMGRDENPRADHIFRKLLRENGRHVGALCGLAAVSLGAGRARDAERLLRQALRQSAHLPLIRRGLAQACLEDGRLPEAEAQVRHSLLIEPDAASGWVILGSVLAHTMRQAEALEAYDQALRVDAKQIRVLLSKGHAFKTLGRRAEAEAAYQRCLELQPDFGEAYYSFADLKNYAFPDAQVAAMQELLRRSNTPANNLALVNFALGRAHEQRAQYREAFAQYAAGNSARRRSSPFDAAAFEQKCKRVAALFDARFLQARRHAGSADPSPIFVVGLPRSGSTLVEQVLASHSQVEGTMELPQVLTFVREFDHAGGARDAYPESLSAEPMSLWRALGARYLEETAIYRGGRPRFIDKMPNNFSHIGLIHLMLPNATLIDVRRHPMDACFSAYKQHFAQGQTFSYDLEDLGRYYRSYLMLMDHWDEVLPGKVFHLAYEDLVRDTEPQVRRLLGHCGLEFESACLRFHETRRSVRTASSEQVRVPIYASSIGHWRHFEAELEPLRRSLGEALERFEGVCRNI